MQQEIITKERKIFELERKLKSKEDEIERLKQERDRLQQELDKTILELKRTKIELALCEERKNESEQCYKNEIKYLIDKLLKTKNKLNKERQIREDDDQLEAVLQQ